MTKMTKLAALGLLLSGFMVSGCAAERQSIADSKAAAEQAATEAKQAAAEAKAAAEEAKAAADKASRSYGRSLRK
jgi:hypothetical protein